MAACLCAGVHSPVCFGDVTFISHLHAFIIATKTEPVEAFLITWNRNPEPNKGFLKKKKAIVHFFIALISLILMSQSKASFLSKEIKCFFVCLFFFD